MRPPESRQETGISISLRISAIFTTETTALLDGCWTDSGLLLDELKIECGRKDDVVVAKQDQSTTGLPVTSFLSSRGRPAERTFPPANKTTAKTLSPEVFIAYRYDEDTNWTPKHVYWADNRSYHRTLPDESCPMCRNMAR